MCETTSLKQSKLKDSDIDKDTLIEFLQMYKQYLFVNQQLKLISQSATAMRVISQKFCKHIIGKFKNNFVNNKMIATLSKDLRA